VDARGPRWRLCALVLVGACGGDGEGAGNGDGLPGAGSEVTVVDRTQLVADPPQRQVLAAAQLYAGAPPAFHQLEATQGACALWRYEPGFCDPACVDGWCVEGMCSSSPEPLERGTMTIETPGGRYVDEGYQGRYGGALADLALAEGDPVEVEFAGGPDGGALRLSGTAVAPLVAALGPEIELQPGQPAIFEWTPSAAADDRVSLELLAANDSGHGTPLAAFIVCDVDDDAGVLEVPATLVDALPAITNPETCVHRDCPDSRLRRYRTAATAGVELTLSAELVFGLVYTPAP
jgi:hypothetical protein